MNAYLAVAVGIVAAAAAILALAAVPPQDDPDYFEINATYNDGTISISFRDHSDGTENVSMEILGMSETFRKTYESGTSRSTYRFSDRQSTAGGRTRLFSRCRTKHLGSSA